ncbi:hypothetical protein P3G55_26610, partial [Leptospira sp. 96542]|nr:hypothetical protein [Leptospira sp. 96542]
MPFAGPGRVLQQTLQAEVIGAQARVVGLAEAAEIDVIAARPQARAQGPGPKIRNQMDFGQSKTFQVCTIFEPGISKEEIS